MPILDSRGHRCTTLKGRLILVPLAGSCLIRSSTSEPMLADPLAPLVPVLIFLPLITVATIQIIEPALQVRAEAVDSSRLQRLCRARSSIACSRIRILYFAQRDSRDSVHCQQHPESAEIHLPAPATSMWTRLLGSPSVCQRCPFLEKAQNWRSKPTSTTSLTS